MSLAIVQSRAISGIDALPVLVEVHLSRGMPGFYMVGMPEKAVRESKDRVRSAIINSRFEFPTAKIIVNLAPADLPKNSGHFDLPIAIGILAASKQIPKDSLGDYELAGELALNGDLRAIKGALLLALACSRNQRNLIVPFSNAKEAAYLSGIQLFPACSLMDVGAHFLDAKKLSFYHVNQQTMQFSVSYLDFADVVGQRHAKRSLEIAAAGGHSLLMIGPPGAGKTMLASRMPSILPPMSEQEAIEVALLYSISRRGFTANLFGKRPFRAPHHTASAVAMIGGGNPPKPGEISLAHGGILFLDELPEFNRQVLEVLREPLEMGIVSIARASYHVEFPASVQLIAAMNPCPCGYYGDKTRVCRCTHEQVQRYQQRLSGPLLDRLDMHVVVKAVCYEQLLLADTLSTESSQQMLNRVLAARRYQLKRANKVNSKLSNHEINRYCQIQKNEIKHLQATIQKLGLSARAYYRILKLARTIADLAGDKYIRQKHWQEAFSYRQLDRPMS